jgi:uncharacterized protein DUF6794
MKSLFGFLLCAQLVGSLVGCRAHESAPNPRPPANSSATESIYVPKNLDDALRQLDLLLGDEGRSKVLSATEDGMVDYHMGLGLWMRNNWGLWRGSRLAAYFNHLGIYHPDDMSGIILDSYWRKLHGKRIELDAQVRSYQDFWKKSQGSK